MKWKKGKYIRPLHLAYGAIFLIALQCAAALFLSANYATSNDAAKEDLGNKDWYLIEEDGSYTPILPPYDAQDSTLSTLRLSRLLPSALPDTPVLCFPSSHCLIKGYLDGTLIYNNSQKVCQPFGSTWGVYWNFIPLSSDYSGKELILEFTWLYKSHSGNIRSFLLDNPISCISTVISRNLFGFLISTCILALGGFLFAGYFIVRRYIRINKELLYLGSFALAFGFWSLDETNILRIFIYPGTALYILKSACLMLLPVPLIYFLKAHFGLMKKKSHCLLTYALFSNFFIQTVLYITGTANYIQGYLINLFFIALSLVVLSCQAVFPALKSMKPEKRHVLIVSLAALFFMTSLDMIRYLYHPNIDAAFFSRLGVFLYLLFLAGDAMRQVSTLISLSHSAHTFRHLAYHDDLTRVRNRTAFTEKLTELEKSDIYKDTTLVMFDVNNLKQLNDRCGHGIGDKVLINGAAAIGEAFYGHSSCYRIGGDEFAVILPGHASFASYESCIHNMKLLIDEYNESNPDYPLSIAYGSAHFTPGVDTSLNDTLKRADKEMYKKKVQMKVCS